MNQPSLPPLSDEEAAQTARRLIQDGYRPDMPVATSYRDATPVPAVGTAPPVPQPGRPPMSQRATDLSGVMLAAGITSVPLAGSASLVLWTVGSLDPVVVALICGTPVAVLGALSRVVRRTKDTVAAAPPTHHHHYGGAQIYQDHSTHSTHTRGLIARTRNQTHR
ncbi:hypothetical protein ACFXP3_10295 [Streptomyces sp. NPDC059096]|uniref:hypothetical protein n=1 Tax=Streptomyces sp. NPDC059096 TaxID=3346727 RepID=UPI00369DBCD5